MVLGKKLLDFEKFSAFSLNRYYMLINMCINIYIMLVKITRMGEKTTQMG